MAAMKMAHVACGHNCISPVVGPTTDIPSDQHLSRYCANSRSRPASKVLGLGIGRGAFLRRQMQRREFMTVVGGAAASLPLLAARAQQAGKVYRIGFLSYRGCGASLDPNGAFRRGLSEVGYIEGRNLV